MIVPMKHLDLVCLASDRDATLERLRLLGAVHLELSAAGGEAVAKAKGDIADAERALLLNGKERPRKAGEEVGIWQNIGDSLTFTFDEAKKLGSLRLQFDPDFSRLSVSKDFKVRMYATKVHTSADFEPVKVPNTIVKNFVVYADGKAIFMAKDNYLSLVKIPLDVEAKELRIEWLATNGAEKVHLYSADILDA